MSSATVITEEQVTEAFKAVIAQYGEDTVYIAPGADHPNSGAQCFYADPETGEPSCVVGHIISRISEELFGRVKEYERDGDSFGIGQFDYERYSIVNEFGVEGDGELVRGDFDMPAYVRNALASAQARQDTGKTWGESFEAYESSLDHYRQYQN